MMDFLAQIENSGFSAWIRESTSLLAYPLVLFLHTVGLGLLVGFSSVIDLQVLGFTPGLPMAPMERFYPVVWIGFWISAASGVVLFVIDATKWISDPVFWIKMAFIALALVDVRLIRKSVFRDPMLDQKPLTGAVKILAMASLFFWLGAITAGRLTAYLGQ